MVPHGYRGGPAWDYPPVFQHDLPENLQISLMIFPFKYPFIDEQKPRDFTCSEPKLRVSGWIPIYSVCDTVMLIILQFLVQSRVQSLVFWIAFFVCVKCRDRCYHFLLFQRPWLIGVCKIRIVWMIWLLSMTGLHLDTRWIDRQTSSTINRCTRCISSGFCSNQDPPNIGYECYDKASHNSHNRS